MKATAHIKTQSLVLAVFLVLALALAAWPVQRAAASPIAGNLLVFKFLDADADGVYDPGESPLANWQFCVGANCATTNTYGFASWSGLPLGNQTVVETLQPGWGNSTPLSQVGQAVSTSMIGVPGPTSVTLGWGGNSYLVEYVSTVDSTWTYRVTELSGKDLSHWDLGMIACQYNVISGTAGYSLGVDGSTGFPGIKWNTDSSFTSGLFSFTLDKNFPAGTVDALAKAGTDYITGQIYGPICEPLFGNYQLGKIIIQQETIPSPDPTDTEFPFTPGGGLPVSPFNLKNGGQQSFDNLPVGTYNVSQGAPTSPYQWSLESATCDNGSPVNAIAVAPGETVTCIFVNRLWMDYGDAPESGLPIYQTTLASDGARHIPGNLWLGARIDAEFDGQPNPSATGDDVSPTGNPSDEDGVDRGVDPWTPTSGSVIVTVGGTGDGCLSAWWDFWNGVDPTQGSNGSFLDRGEKIIDNKLVHQGTQTIEFSLPRIDPADPTSDPVISFPIGGTFARFRLTPVLPNGTCTSSTLGPTAVEATPVLPTGLQLNGEVEDYMWGNNSTAVTLQGFTAASQASRSAGLPLLGIAAVLVSGLAIVWNREKKVAMKSEATTVSVETGKTYLAPAIVHEMDLETRAGSPLGVQQFNPVLGPEFQEVK